MKLTNNNDGADITKTTRCRETLPFEMAIFSLKLDLDKLLELSPDDEMLKKRVDIYRYILTNEAMEKPLDDMEK